VLRGVTGTVGALVSLLIIPVLAYYLLVEFDRIRVGILTLVPHAYQQSVAIEAARVDALISGFIRGQLTVCLVIGVLYAVGFAVIGIDLAIVIGVVSGLLAIVPYVGGALALVSAAGMALLQFGVGTQLALVVGWYFVVQGLEGFVLTPKIVGGSLGMHPVTVIVALLIGGDLLGFLGLLIAVPVAAVVQVFVQDLVAMYRESPLYREPPGTTESS
jgi:predicted PurR-regulated permease PerM